MKTIILRTLSVCLLSSAAMAAEAVPAPALVTVGDPGNPGNHRLRPTKYEYGRVDYVFRIGADEVNNREYAAFLNAAAASDPHKLYHPREDNPIRRHGEDGAYRYDVADEQAELPVRFVSKLAAARYCNYLTTGRLDAGAYDFKAYDDAERVSGLRDTWTPTQGVVYFLPDLDEWYKAGYYKGGAEGGYWAAPDQSDDFSRKGPGPYGTRAQAGGVAEWVESTDGGRWPYAWGAADADLEGDDPGRLRAQKYTFLAEHAVRRDVGFRVAATAEVAPLSRLNAGNNYFTFDDLRANLRIRSEHARRARVAYRLLDVNDRPVLAGEGDIDLAAGVTTAFSFELPAREAYYELEVAVDGLPAPLRTPLAVMAGDLPRELTAGGTYGVHTHLKRWEQWFYQEKSLDETFRLHRLLGPSTIRVDSDPDYNRLAHEQGYEVLPGLETWNHSSYPFLEKNKASPEIIAKWAEHKVPAEFAAVAERAYDTVLRNKEFVRHYEMGNEPQAWSILAQDYAQMAKALHTAGKLADPDAQMLLGDSSATLRSFLEAGAGDFCDGVSFHVYGWFHPYFWGHPNKITALRARMKAHGIGDKPLWLTETGVCDYSSVHMIQVRTLAEMHRYQALTLPKILAGCKVLGVERIIAYNFRDVPTQGLEGEFGLIRRDYLPKPAFMAFRAASRLTGKAAPKGVLDNLPQGFMGFLFEKDGAQTALVYRVDLFTRQQSGENGFFKQRFADIIGEPATLRLAVRGGEVEVFDLFGAGQTLAAPDGELALPVDEYPVYVRGDLDWTVKDEWPRPVAFPEYEPTRAMIRIMPPPDNRAKAYDMVSGVNLRYPTAGDLPVRCRVYNLTDEAVSGEVVLTPPDFWRADAMAVAPARFAVDIPPRGMATASFTLRVPYFPKLDTPLILKAEFRSEHETVFDAALMTQKP